MGTSTPLSCGGCTLGPLRRFCPFRPIVDVGVMAVFGFASGVARTKPLMIALSPHRLFADQTARAVEARVTTPDAKGEMLILYRPGKLGAAMFATAIVLSLARRRALRVRSAHVV